MSKNKNIFVLSGYDALGNLLLNPDGRVCIHYQSRLHLFTHLCLGDKQIVAITL